MAPRMPGRAQGARADGPGLQGQLAALVWLRSREFLGDRRDPARLWALGTAVLVFAGTIIAGVHLGAASGRLHPAFDSKYVCAAAWVLWAITPLLGGGGGELVGSQ